MQRTITLAIGVALAVACLALAVLVAVAHAVEVHQHYYVDHGPVVREVMRVVHVAPPDRDDDGLANAGDDCPRTASTTASGCPPVVDYSLSAYSGGSVYDDASAGSVASCESGGDPSAVDASGTYHGAYQFDDPTFQAASGLSGSASDYDMATQTAAFQAWYPAHPEAWPNC